MPSKHKTRLWAHGVSVLAQEPEKFKIERFSWGARVSPLNTPSTTNKIEGWFHFAIPTPTKMDSNNIRTNDFFLSLVRDGFVLIKQVLCTPVQDLGTQQQTTIIKRYHETEIVDSIDPDPSDTPDTDDRDMQRKYEPTDKSGGNDAYFEWDIKDDIINGPVCISVWLEFHIPGTYVIFRGAGVQFAEEGTY